MAIVDDIRQDKRTTNVLNQTNTKTVSAPPTSTGLIGDQLPAEVFTVDDFDLVKNQVHLEERNFQLIEALNKMGQITNTQSQSGPIPGTFEIVQKSGTSVMTLLEPDAGTVWQLQGLAVSTFAASSINFRFNDGTTNMLLATASAAGVVTTVPDAPIYVTSPAKIDCSIVSSSGTNIVQGAFIRVR